LRLVRLPTTTLAQADSGVGVKNAVNLFGKKNWLGTFAVPWAVINDTTLLATLPDRDFVCGFSEAVKVSLLKDPKMFAGLCETAARIRRRDLTVALPAIRASADWHRRHITCGGDPFESLEARPLDFGHWSAHRLEAMTDFQVRHGEAVSIGLALDTVYSSLALGLSSEVADRVLRCLADLGLPLGHPALRDGDALFQGLEEFRQHLGGRLTLTMLRGVGDPIDVHEIDEALMRKALRRLERLAPAAWTRPAGSPRAVDLDSSVLPGTESTAGEAGFTGR
jgi:3-dehydroquinate synthase